MEFRQHKERAIVIALLASLVLWNLPFGGVLFYPFKLFATWMHEFSHGLVMLISGAGFDRMEIYRDTSGLSFAQRASGEAGRAAIAAAGYMGTPLFGALFLILGQGRRAARAILATLGVLLAVSAVLLIDNAFGKQAAAAGAVLCLGGAFLASESAATLAVNFIAAQAAINALLDIRVLFRSNLVVNGQVMGASDAHNMADATFGTPTMWAAVWLVWSFILLYAALRIVYVRQRVRPDEPTPALAPDPERASGKYP